MNTEYYECLGTDQIGNTVFPKQRVALTDWLTRSLAVHITTFYNNF
jgi:hypothetical protein